ncbi:hypothetical protein MHLNE_10200 [Moorella humiferrea]
MPRSTPLLYHFQKDCDGKNEWVFKKGSFILTPLTSKGT